MLPDSHFAERLKLGEEMALLLADTMSKAPATSYTQIYTLNLAMQFWSNLKAAMTLLSAGFDSEAWTVGRSMVEIFVRAKWVQERKSNAPWVTIGLELNDLNRFVSYKDRSRLRRAAIAELQAGLDSIAPMLSKRGRFWDKKRGKLRRHPSVDQMAKECHAVKIYRGFFKHGSDHAHSSHQVITRFMVFDAQRNWTGRFVLDRPPGDNLSFTSYHILNLAMLFLHVLEKSCGWPADIGCRASIGQRFIAIRPTNYLKLVRLQSRPRSHQFWRSTLPRSLGDHKFGERKVAWISDFEIEILVWDENDFAAELFDGGYFVGDRHIFRHDSVVSFEQEFSRKNLRRLHGVKLIAID